VIQIFTKEQIKQQLFLTLISAQGKERAECCQTETRRLLERVRDGEASQKETEIVAQAVKLLGVQTKHRADSQLSRTAYVLAIHYLAPEQLTATEIAKIIHVNTRTVHRYILQGIEQLAILIFGVDALEWQ